jgi:hypothetical protein
MEPDKRAVGRPELIIGAGLIRIKIPAQLAYYRQAAAEGGLSFEIKHYAILEGFGDKEAAFLFRFPV